MSPRARRSARITLATLVAIVGSGVLFVTVTAAQSAGTISIALPSPGELLVTGALALLTFFARRLLKQFDRLGDKCDATHESLTRFEARVSTALFERGGLVDDVRDLQRSVYHDDGPAPRGVVAPRDFTLSPITEKTKA